MKLPEEHKEIIEKLMKDFDFGPEPLPKHLILLNRAYWCASLFLAFFLITGFCSWIDMGDFWFEYIQTVFILDLCFALFLGYQLSRALYYISKFQYPSISVFMSVMVVMSFLTAINWMLKIHMVSLICLGIIILITLLLFYYLLGDKGSFVSDDLDSPEDVYLAFLPMESFTDHFFSIFTRLPFRGVHVVCGEHLYGFKKGVYKKIPLVFFLKAIKFSNREIKFVNIHEPVLEHNQYFDSLVGTKWNRLKHNCFCVVRRRFGSITKKVAENALYAPF